MKGSNPSGRDSSGALEKDVANSSPVVLLVDDEPAILRAARRVLEHGGFRVLTAADGCEAEAILRQAHDQVSLVVTDMLMPNMDGLALIRSIRKDSSELKIIVASGFLGPDLTIEELRQLNVHAHLPKPYTRTELLDTIDRELSGRA